MENRQKKSLRLLQMSRSSVAVAIVATMVASCSGQKWHEENHGKYSLILQDKGQTLGYCPESEIKLITKNGYAFKDLNRNDTLDIYEDWRKSPRERAEDLASKMSIDEIAGLMLYSIHQAVPSDYYSFWGSLYEGSTLEAIGLPHSTISDRQKVFLKDDNLRAILLVRAESPKIAAEWNNNLQAYAETLPLGIPVNISSDPRHETVASAEFNAGAGGAISLWPSSLGLAATFDPELVENFGKVLSIEYRALGITTALSPQIDLATEPRWLRFYGTFGEDPILVRDLSRAIVDGMQTSEGEYEIKEGWGYHSVNAMVKHWPSGGPEEAGRDAHNCYGKFAVYPGNNLKTQIIPFVDGAFKLSGKTSSASAVMPYYTISYGLSPDGSNVGNSYSKYLISELLRDKYSYDGVVCTDWGITHDYSTIEESDGKAWGVSELSENERHFKAIEAGVDQFGGNNVKAPVIDAYRVWSEKYGEESARERFEKSAVRLLMNMFRPGLFDNPYVNPEETEAIVGCPEYMQQGYDAQLKSVVMLKNAKSSLPMASAKKVYIPKKIVHGGRGYLNVAAGKDKSEYSVDTSLVAKYFKVVLNPEEADFSIVFIDEPDGGLGYSTDDRKKGGNGYVPISLQYSDYTATDARDTSIAGGDPLESFTNRTYKGKTVKTTNKSDLDLVIDTKSKMGDKPVIVSVLTKRPFVPEFEPYADAILLSFSVQSQVIMDVINGNFEPTGLLPIQMPLNMSTVEKQMEDVPRDMECYRDSEGNIYDFAFGLNWSGTIDDKRVKRYKTF